MADLLPVMVYYGQMTGETPAPGTDRQADGLPGAIGIALAVALSLFGDMAMYVILPVSFAEIGLTAIQVGILLSANRWIRLLTNRIAERTLRRVGAALPFLASLIGGSVIASLYALVPGFWILLILRVSWGVCWSFIRHTGVMTTVGVAGNRPSRYLGIYLAFLQGGFVAGTFVAGLLFDSVGYRSALLIASALSLSALAPGVLGLRRSAAATGAPDSPLRLPLRKRGFAETASLSARGFTVSLVSAGLVMSTLGYLLKSRLGESTTIGGLSIGITTLTGAVLASRYVISGAGSPVFGILIDRVGVTRVQVISYLVAGGSLVASAFADTIGILLPFVILFFAGSAISRLAVESEAAQLGARAYSNIATSTDLGSALGPMLGWIGIEVTSSDLVYWAGGGLFLIGAVLAAISWLLSRSPPRSGGTRR